MTAEQLLLDLGQVIELPDLSLDEHGCARLMFDGKLPMQLEHDEAAQALMLYFVLETIPPEGREAVFQQLLKGNLFGATTAGSTLAIDDLNNDIVLWQRVMLETATGEKLARIIEQMLDVAEQWQVRLKERTSEGLADVSHAAGLMDGMLTRV